MTAEQHRNLWHSGKTKTQILAELLSYGYTAGEAEFVYAVETRAIPGDVQPEDKKGNIVFPPRKYLEQGAIY